MRENIQIIQNILKQKNQLDLAIKLENAYYEDYQIDNWNGGIGEVVIYVHPNYFLELEVIDNQTKEMLVKFFNALPHEYYIIITDNLPVASNRKKQEKALKLGVSNYMKEHKLSVRYDIFHHCSASSSNLQIIDYIGWAINRKYEHGDDIYYQKIKSYILSEDVVTKDRDKKYYEK